MMTVIDHCTCSYGQMPSSNKDDIPAELWALVHDLLVESGFSKAAKSLKKNLSSELLPTEGMDDLATIFKNYLSTKEGDKKKRKKNAPVDSSVDTSSKEKAKKPENDVEEQSEPEIVQDEIKTQQKGKVKKPKSTEIKDDSTMESATSESGTPAKGGANQKRNSNSSPFQRVKAEDVTFLKVKGGSAEVKRLKDNTFESKGGDVFGAKASEILSAVRGKDFRHEKTKKKRSFRSSGPIDLSSNSIKFDSDSD